MKKRSLPRQYMVFTAGLFFAAAGISLITKAGLGTSPVTSPAYVLTMLLPLSLGCFTFLSNSVMFLGQVVILRGKIAPIQLLQLPATLVFSSFIDLITWCMRFFEPSAYPARIALLAVGCLSLGLGVALEVLGDVIILPGEGIVKVISQVTHKEFGNVKTVFDLGMVAFAAVLSLIGLGRLAGVREGTVIAATVVGSISRFFRGRLSFLGAPPEKGPDAAGELPGKTETIGA